MMLWVDVGPKRPAPVFDVLDSSINYLSLTSRLKLRSVGKVEIK